MWGGRLVCRFVKQTLLVTATCLTLFHCALVPVSQDGGAGGGAGGGSVDGGGAGGGGGSIGGGTGGGIDAGDVDAGVADAGRMDAGVLVTGVPDLTGYPTNQSPPAVMNASTGWWPGELKAMA